MPTLLIKVADGSEQERSWVGQLTIGGGAGNDLTLEGAGLSDKHARLSETPTGGVEIEDIGSKEGVFVDGQRIAANARTALRPQSAALLGKVRLQLKADPNLAKPTRSLQRVRPSQGPVTGRRRPSAAAPAGPGKTDALAKPNGPPVLVGLEGKLAQQRFPIAGKVTVGRIAENNIVIDDDSVSRRHAELERTGGSVVVRDLESANGTLVNGERLSAERGLKPGDVISFGVVDFRLELPQAAPATRSPPPAAKSVGNPRRRLLLTLGVVGLGILFLGAIAKVLTAPARPREGALGTTAAQEVETLDQLLVRCRSYADVEGEVEPNWQRARTVCEKVRAQDPINTEASEILRRIDRESKNKEAFDHGKKSVERDRGDEAMDWFKKLPANSWYFVRARANLDTVRKDLTQQLSQDCHKYVQHGLYAQAVPHCERYMELVCQDMTEEELRPPADTKIDLGHGVLAEGTWRPRDAAYQDFLRAREKLNPKMVLWDCPRNDVLKSGLGGASGNADLDAKLKVRYPEAAIRHAIFLYWQGKQGDAETVLFRIRDDIRMAKLHEEVESLRKDVDAVQQLYNAGQSELQVEEPDSAAEPFREALELDEKLMGADSLQQSPSWYRTNIRLDMATYAYRKGKNYADRQDRRRACLTWKLGWSFYKGYMELARAIQTCTTWAQNTQMTSCDQAEEVLAYASEGDGFGNKAEAVKTQLHCP